ncbi:helicase-related protein [Streptomyces ipomoeae]|uniref:helicase associated domain-containing protein n=1 Tax=Streptomyces ipomoeae TaxID=103232 RepID=UPI003DA75452
MDRREIFGPIVYRLGMAEAIERGLLADYQVVMPVVGDQQLHAILTRKPHLDPKNGGLRAAALQVAVLRAITDHDLRRVLVFHNRIDAAEAFSEDLPGTAIQLKRSDLQAFWVDGTQRVDERRSRLSAFESAEGCTVLSNVRVLAEGIDIPAIDSVVFAAPRNSVVDAIQAIGRALRLVPGHGKKATLVLPVYLPDGRATEQALHDSQFEGIYTILQALRAHDDSFLDHIAVPRRSRRLSGRSPRRTTYYNRAERALQVALALGLEITLPATGSWHDGLASASRYHHDHHHLDVPHTFHDDTGFALGSGSATSACDTWPTVCPANTPTPSTPSACCGAPPPTPSPASSTTPAPTQPTTGISPHPPTPHKADTPSAPGSPSAAGRTTPTPSPKTTLRSLPPSTAGGTPASL